MAERGRETLRHGPMKPFGLTNAHDPKVRPYAVVQLRQDNALGTLFNIVGFQTKLKYGEQSRIFRMIPGLEGAEFARLGGMHRNTYLNSPRLLDARLRLRAAPRLRFAGQITGCEGYVESAAVGLIAGRLAAAERLGLPLEPPPPTTAIGALLNHITGGHIEIGRHGAPIVPAYERQFRSLSADRRAAVRRKRQTLVGPRTRPRPQARALRAGGSGFGAMGAAGSPADAVRRGLGALQSVEVRWRQTPFGPIDPIWVLSPRRPFAAKTPDFGGWKSLDFLGFSRPNRALSMGYAGISSKFFSYRFCRGEGAVETAGPRFGVAKERHAHRASLASFLIIRNRSLSLAIPF